MSRNLSEKPYVHETAEVHDTTLGRYTEIAERCRVSEAVLGDYSYMMQDCGVWCATIGKFVNIAASVRINATNREVVIGLIAEKKARDTALLGIFHDADVREAVADRIIDVTEFAARPIAA